ncbi:Replication termination factor 2 [Ameca splendens]|uniref:Replication termination factor 2 n=1 Tax=Ameca splendens TaxID=208324 RepID=A0ABV0XGR9_9TELE
MGCDGGTIPKRHELVKGPKKVEKVDKNAELAAKWKYCALSQEKLRLPIVACELGRLYNKDAIIEYLLDKSAERPNAEAVTHIRGIKDIKELNLTDNPQWEGERRNAKGDRYEDIHCSMFICPVVGLEMNGKHRFCYLQTCGCVFSDRALKEVKTEICHKVNFVLFLFFSILMVNGLHLYSALSSPRDPKALYTTVSHPPIHTHIHTPTVVSYIVATATLGHTDRREAAIQSAQPFLLTTISRQGG